ncbi:MAG: hypothetical protein HY695_31035 [Deltaproteobacteria bacterium]|nr:hypothetical protein [Deltaproteobacteria bacterium]
MIRVKGALEIAAELYARQMSSLGDELKISFTSKDSRANRPLSLSLAVNGRLMGGMRAPLEVARRRVDIAYVNPSAIATMAYRGKGIYKQKLPLRALACFPSWDRIAFAVSRDLKIRSLYEIAARKIPLRVSTRLAGVDNATYYAVSKILSLYGLSPARIKQWGGEIEECDRPSSPRRMQSILNRQVGAVFDEGISKWLDEALANGYELVELEPKIIREMERYGFKGAAIPKTRFKSLPRDVRTIDFSGWPLITHKWLDEGVAYSICEAIDRRRDFIPVDSGSLDMEKLCRDTEDAALGIPLHAGARRYYRQNGYLT